MRRDELTDQQAQIALAGAVRNFLPTTRVQFSPWDGFRLAYLDGQLCRVDPLGAFTPLFAAEEVYGKSDAELEAMVFGRPLPKKKSRA